jgi:hypothetical protein
MIRTFESTLMRLRLSNTERRMLFLIAWDYADLPL